MGTVEHDLLMHQRHLDRQDRMAVRKEEIALKLMRERYNPNDPDSLVSAINAASPRQHDEIRRLLEENEFEALGRFLAYLAEDYCIQWSDDEAWDCVYQMESRGEIR